MKSRLFLLNIKEIFTNPLFYLSVAGVAAVIVSVQEFETHMISLIFMMYGGVGIGSLPGIAYAFAVFPFIITHCDDCTNQYIRPVVIRSGVKSYIRAKFAAGFISAFLTLFTGIMLAFAVESFSIPLSDPYNSATEAILLYGCFVEYGMPLLTLIAMTFHFSVIGAVYCVFGLAVSSVLPNKFVTAVTPFIVHSASVFIGSYFPDWLSIFYISNVSWIFWDEAEWITAVNFLYMLFFAAAVTFSVYTVFKIFVTKRINGSREGGL